MTKKKKENIMTCPRCGADLNGAENPARLPKTAQERIEALRLAGVDVSHLFAMQGANGGDYVASNQDGKLTILDDNDPIFSYITSQGDVPNRRLFRRWVMAQMFHMLSYAPYRGLSPLGVTAMIHRLGYEYQWKMLLDELRAQMKMESRDPNGFVERNRWFNNEVASAMAHHYIERLKNHVDNLQERKCKGIPYKRIHSRDIFVSDLNRKLYTPLIIAANLIKYAQNAAQLYDAVSKFNFQRIRLSHDTPQSKTWMDAYKGAGAYFTMQNLIRFHRCLVTDDKGRRLNKNQSLDFITLKATLYKDEGWRMLAVLKKMLRDNDIDIKKKMAEWRKK